MAEDKRDAEVQDYPMLAIECPECGRKHITPRCEDDPKEAVKAIILCPEFCAGDFGTTTYLNKTGDEVDANII